MAFEIWKYLSPDPAYGETAPTNQGIHLSGILTAALGNLLLLRSNT